MAAVAHSAHTARTFAVATFGRVFDMHPQADALTLDELAQALTRFQLKPQLAARIDKELAKFRRGEGPFAVKEKGKKFTDVEIEHQIKREAKTDLRIWTPALFVPGARRESDNIVHISCLVYDIDDKLSLDDARAAFDPWWHVGHSTWSHTEARPKFRVCLPFARPVVPDDFLAVWDFGDAAIGGGADRTGRNVARGMALPALASPDAPRAAWVHIAPLFDPVGEGIARASTVTTPEPTGLSYMRLDPSESYLRIDVATDSVEDDPWSGGATIAPRRSAEPKAAPVTPDAIIPARQAVAPAPAAPVAPITLESLAARVAELEARLAAIERDRR